jgi:hypothetical protein
VPGVSAEGPPPFAGRLLTQSSFTADHKFNNRCELNVDYGLREFRGARLTVT